MSQTVAILGRQPSLGLAELESLFGPEETRPLESGAVVIDAEPDAFPMSRLGGTLKAGRFITELPITDLDELESHLVEHLPGHLAQIPEGKIRLGLSAYGFKASPKRLNAIALTLKKAVKANGRSVRVVPNGSSELNAAQVIHNQLTGPTGFEILMIKNGGKTVLAQTFAVQDIDAYAARDQARPKRDARVGMLPPKLAQIIINLADGKRQTADGLSILDPFCGTGVVLQEALLMGYDVYGTDLDDRMIDYSKVNLDWLATQHDLSNLTYLLESGDATSFEWQAFDSVACETYLGQPFSAEPKPEKLRQVMQDVDTIHKKFLQNIARQTEPGLRMCIAVPAWKTKSGFKHLRTLENLEDLGYTRVSFAHVRSDQLLYHREGQVVARELVVLTRK